jgi:hypothetical protein
VTPAVEAAGAPATPGLRRRLACFLYEGVLLFGVVMIAGLLYGLVTRQQHALVGLHGLQAFLSLVLGVYFVVFWSRSGQTLAMQTWHIRLVSSACRVPLPAGLAVVPAGAGRAGLQRVARRAPGVCGALHGRAGLCGARPAAPAAPVLARCGVRHPPHHLAPCPAP